jgi:galactose mutarotase-like enzyme
MNKVSIENNFLWVDVLLKGGELCSIYHKPTDRECLWQANPYVWGNHAPILFPTIGKLLNSEFRHQNRTYPHPKHGIVRDSKMSMVDPTSKKYRTLLDLTGLIDQTIPMAKPTPPDLSLWMELVSSPETKRQYPFDFEFFVGYTLDGETLHQHFVVKNTGSTRMPFALGGHPGFSLPISDTESLESCYLEFEQHETLDRHLISEEGFFTGKVETFLVNERNIRLNATIFDEDALVFHSPKSNKITLRSDHSPYFVEFNFEKFPILAIWAKPNAPFVCLEPWFGHADFEDAPVDFIDKPGMIKLDPGKTFQASFSMRFG